MTNSTGLSRQEILKTFVAGFTATIIMTLLLLPLAQVLKIGVFDFAGVLGSVFTDQSVKSFSNAWWLGMVEHLINGSIVFPLAFLFVQKYLIPNQSRVLQGILWGIFLWIGWQLIIMPMAGSGIFSNRLSDWPFILFMTFNGHVVYGSLFGALRAREKVENVENIPFPYKRTA